MGDPVASEEALTTEHRHPDHPDVRFFVDTNLQFWAERGRAEKVARIDFGPARSEEALVAWARHVEAHLGLLAFPPPGSRTEWWWGAGAERFAELMVPLASDVAAFRDRLDIRLAEAISQLACGVAALPGQRGPIDLGPLGSLTFERVVDPAWEPHVRAVLQPQPGDPYWYRPDPAFFAPASTMHAVARDYLDAFAAAARSGGRPVYGRARDANDVIFTFHHDRVEPARFVMHPAGRWEITVPARQLVTTEIAGEYAFVGAKLVIVVADGTRTAFKLDVPPDLDRSVPPMVSGFWTARSGERFASILRVGSRVWRFDNDGKLLA